MHAAELMSTGDVMEAKQWMIDIYGRHAESEPIVSLSDGGSMQVPVSGGETTIFAGSDADVEMEQSYDSLSAAFRYRPHDGLTYRFKAGMIQNFELEFSSGSHANKLSSLKDGLVWGLGLEWNVSPGTIVSPAITLDASWEQHRLELDRFESPGVNAASSTRLVQDEFQLAVNVSKRFKKWQPFGGLKVNRVITELKDDATKEKVDGIKDGVSPFLGLQYEWFPNEMVFIEGSFVDDESVNAGIKIRL